MFKLEISLGNAAMRTGFDLATALRNVADQVETEIGAADIYDERITAKRFVRDVNGNRVGSMSIYFDGTF